MIDLNKIRSMAKLQEIKDAVLEFLNFPADEMLKAYVEDFQWCENDYLADKEDCQDLLEKVERRMASLEKYLNRSKTLKEPVKKSVKEELAETEEVEEAETEPTTLISSAL